MILVHFLAFSNKTVIRKLRFKLPCLSSAASGLYSLCMSKCLIHCEENMCMCCWVKTESKFNFYKSWVKQAGDKCVHLTQRIPDLKGLLKAQKKCFQELSSAT